jgi:uncharacterized membrane protein
MENFTDLQVVLKFLVGGGAPVVIAGAMSYLAENWSKWHEFPKWFKFVLPVLVSALLAVGAQILMGYADVVNAISPWYTIVAVTVLAWVNSQKAYANTKATGYGVHNIGSTIEIYDVSDEEDVK